MTNNGNNKDAVSDTSSSDELTYQIHSSFWKCAKKGFLQFIEQAPAAWRSRDARFYRSERKLVEKHVMEPLYWGSVTTLVLFATFRVSGSRFYQNWRKEVISSWNWGTTTTRVTNTTTLIPPTPPAVHPQSPVAQERQHLLLLRESYQLPFDVFLSIMLGLSAVVWLSKPTPELSHDFVRTPLLPGRSLIHKHVCPLFVQEYKEEWRRAARNDTTAQTFDAFVRNCQLRSQIITQRERELRQKQQPPLSLCRPADVIPYPGIQDPSDKQQEMTVQTRG